MTLRKNPSYLVKHRKKWQVKLTIPSDIRWAFENKTTFKRSTGCDLIDLEQALIERDRLVAKFKERVRLHRAAMRGVEPRRSVFADKFNNRPYPKTYQNWQVPDALPPNASRSDVEGWINERLLNKEKNPPLLPHDFWHIDKKKSK